MPKDNKRPVNGVRSNWKSSDQNLKIMRTGGIYPAKGVNIRTSLSGRMWNTLRSLKHISK